MYNPHKMLQQLRSERNAVQARILDLEKRAKSQNIRDPSRRTGNRLRRRGKWTTFGDKLVDGAL